MSWSEKDLAEAYGELADRSMAPCPDATVLERYLLGTASAAERNALADHLELCRRCSGFLQELRGLPAWAERAAAVEPRSPGRWGASRWLPAVAASLALLLAGAGVWSWLSSGSSPRQDVERGVERTVEPAPGAVVTQAPVRFDWADEPGATRYRFELYDDRALLVWRSEELESSACELPEEIAAELEEGRSYSWRVDVEGPVRRTQVGPNWFTLEASPARP